MVDFISCLQRRSCQLATRRSHSNGPDHGPEILFVTKGEAETEGHRLQRGEALIVPEGVDYHVSGSAIVYKATVPR